jgi:ankyrin repeat protein
MEDNLRRLKASLQLFDKLGCCSSGINENLNNVDAALLLVDIDKMRYNVINCLTAIHLVQTEMRMKEAVVDNDNYELVKSKVFNAAISMISDDKFDSSEAVVKTILSGFPIPDGRRRSDEWNWQSQHFAIALGVMNKISEDDIRIMLSVDPLRTQRLIEREAADVSIVSDQGGRFALHLVAQYSESLELLEDILRIDHKMTKMVFIDNDSEEEKTALGLLCRRSHFPTFDAMILCLIEADSSVEVIFDGIVSHIESYNKCLSQEISPGSRGAMSLLLFETLLHANSAVTKYDDSWIFHLACIHLRGELGVSVLSLLLTKDGTGVKAIDEDGYLPIHVAAEYSCVDVVKFLHKAWPESISMLAGNDNSLLHLAVMNDTSDIADVIAKVRYICDQCPALLHLKNSDGNTPLFYILKNVGRFNFECVKILCRVDPTVARDRCTPPTTLNWYGHSGRLPLHILIDCHSPNLEVSVEGDCFRLLLRLYPAAAGIEDGLSRSPYDLAVGCGLSPYFKRLLLAADPTIDPVRRHNINFAARRQGMFLAFRALSSDKKPTIWTKMRLKGRDLLEHVISYL